LPRCQRPSGAAARDGAAASVDRFAAGADGAGGCAETFAVAAEDSSSTIAARIARLANFGSIFERCSMDIEDFRRSMK
jgi:hypothetical protein